jgi:hypothetical protein
VRRRPLDAEGPSKAEHDVQAKGRLEAALRSIARDRRGSIYFFSAATVMAVATRSAPFIS